jgi:hypothetical protein
MNPIIKILRLAALFVVSLFIAANGHAQTFLTNGLIVFYPFSGNANDASGNGNNGTNFGATLTTNRFGMSNAAFYFNGSSYINVGNVISNYSAVTFSAWFQTTNFINGKENGIVMKERNDGGIGARLGVFGTNYDAAFNDSQNNIVVFGANSVQSNLWHQATLVNDSSNIFLYVDGTLAGQTPTPYNLHASGAISGMPTIIGNDPSGGNRFFTGAIDDVRIYNRAMSANEVAQLYAYESGYILNINRAVFLSSDNLNIGLNYQVQVSSDLANWTNQGSVFTASSSIWQSTNYWPVANWNQLFFRVVQQ